MKRHILLAYLCTFCALAACQQETQSPIYVPGRSWKFTVRNSDSTRIDTLTLRVFDEAWCMLQTKISWELEERDSLSSKTSTEDAGVFDNATIPFPKRELWMFPPRSGYLRHAELVAFPQVRFPVTQGVTIHREIKAVNRWEKLNGESVKGNVTVIGKVLYKSELLKDSCWKLQATGTSNAGTYAATYYFHPQKGFVYFLYDFNKYTCEIDLLSTNF